MDNRDERPHTTAPPDQRDYHAAQAASTLERTDASLAARTLETLDHLRGTVSWIGDDGGLVAGATTLGAFLGIAPQDLTGAGWLNALDPVERRSAAVEWKRALAADSPLTTQWRFLHADGMITPMRVTLQPMTAQEGAPPLWLCVAQPAVTTPPPPHEGQPLTEDSEAGRANAARIALDSMADAIFGLDENGRFIFANPSAQECFASAGETLIGRTFAEVTPALCGSLLDNELKRIARQRTPGIVESYIPLAKAWYEIRTYPTPSGYAIHMRDIAYRRSILDRLDAALKSAEATRADAEARAHELDAAIESVVDGLIVYNASGEVQRANRTMRSLWSALGGGDPATISVHSTRDAANPTASEALREAMTRVWRRIMSGESFTGANAVDITARISDENILELSVSGGPVFGERGQILGAVETVRDVTAQRQSDRERVRMLSFVAHELRTPLTTVKLSLDLAIRRFAKHIPIEPTDLSVTLDGVQQIERMVEDLVDAARSDNHQLRLTRERCDLRELCAQAVKEQTAATGRQTRYEPPPEPLWIVADRVRIHQVLANLLSNALKYSPNDTPVDLLVERRDGQVWAGVRDRGPGVPAEAQAKLFQAFYRATGAQTARGPHVGLGLGLFLCKRLVELHDGQIGFTSGPRDGSLFWFTLPLAAEENTAPVDTPVSRNA